MQGGHDVWIVPTAAVVRDFSDGVVPAKCRAVSTVTGHRVQRIAYRHYPRSQRDGGAGQSIGVPLAIPALVVPTDHRQRDVVVQERS